MWDSVYHYQLIKILVMEVVGSPPLPNKAALLGGLYCLTNLYGKEES